LSTNFPSDQPDLSDWISQAEAAELRGVSRQAISKLIRTGRLKTFEVGGHVLVSRSEVLGFQPESPGRPRSMENRDVDRILGLVRKCDPTAREEALRRLREEYPIHPLEAKLGAPAELILEAIHRAGPLTLRGIRGVLAESAFELNVVKKLVGWTSLPTPNDPPYDFLLDDGQGPVKVQVKLQRKKADRPMLASEGYRWLSPEMFAVETQRTRGGKDLKTGEDTRPYRFGEFDILAVATEPSTGRWDTFMYTLGRWLIPRLTNNQLLLKFQPVPASPNSDWTGSFEACVDWFRSGLDKSIGGSMLAVPGEGDLTEPE
jgi:excisionase family DNA binding protein